MKKRKSKKQKRSTTKVMLFSVLVVCAVMLSAIIAAWVIWDRTDAAGLAGVVAAPAAVVVGFYEWKAKAENLARYGKNKNVEDLNDD